MGLCRCRSLGLSGRPGRRAGNFALVCRKTYGASEQGTGRGVIAIPGPTALGRTRCRTITLGRAGGRDSGRLGASHESSGLSSAVARREEAGCCVTSKLEALAGPDPPLVPFFDQSMQATDGLAHSPACGWVGWKG